MNFLLFPFAYALAELVPLIGKWIDGEQGERVAQQAVGIAQAITGEKDQRKVIGSLKGDPVLLEKFKVITMGSWSRTILHVATISKNPLHLGRGRLLILSILCDALYKLIFLIC